MSKVLLHSKITPLQHPIDYYPSKTPVTIPVTVEFASTTVHVTACVPSKVPRSININNHSAVSLGWPHFTAPPSHYVSPPPLDLIAHCYHPPLTHTHAHTHVQSTASLLEFILPFHPPIRSTCSLIKECIGLFTLPSVASCVCVT